MAVNVNYGLQELKRSTLRPVLSRKKLPHVLLMISILQYLKDPKLWEFWHIPYYG